MSDLRLSIPTSTCGTSTQNLPGLTSTDGTITHYKVEDLEAEYARQAGVEFVGVRR